MKLGQLVISDYKKYKKYGGNIITILFFTQSFWAILQYRFAHVVYRSRVSIIKQLLQLICLLWQKLIEIATGISIPASAQIGHSFYIGHFGGIILNANAVIGSNCNISKNGTVSVSGQGDRGPCPEIVENGVTGWLVDPYNPEAIATKIRSVFQNPDEAQKIGRKAREVALNRYNIEKLVNENQKFYLKNK